MSLLFWAVQKWRTVLSGLLTNSFGTNSDKLGDVN